jgi:serine protease AprX
MYLRNMNFKMLLSEPKLLTKSITSIYCLPIYILSICSILFTGSTQVYGQGTPSQTKAIVFLASKQPNLFTVSSPGAFLSSASLARRARLSAPVTEADLPVSQVYLDSIRVYGLEIVYTSRWLNAAMVAGDSSTIARIAQKPWASGSQALVYQPSIPNLTTLVANNTAAQNSFSSIQLQINRQARFGTASATEASATLPDYGLSQNQATMLGIDSMHARGYTGRGVLAAVLDAGFSGVNRHAAFTTHFAEGRILGTYNFIRKDSAVYAGYNHGGSVLSCMGGNFPGNFIGGGYNASYYLFETEDIGSETPQECFYWVVGAEKADSLGVQLINTSLGYTNFDNPALNFNRAQFDGATYFLSRGVNEASRAGILCVSSAGNDGFSPGPSGMVGSPADAALGLTIGGVRPDSTYAAFSSRGYRRGSLLKPNVTAQAVACVVYSPNDPNGIGFASGTSFSSPMIAGLMAGLMEQFPNRTPAEWIALLQASGSNAATPDTLLGYGIPNYNRILGPTALPDPNTNSFFLFPNPIRSNSLLTIRTADSILQAYLTDISGKTIAFSSTTLAKSGAGYAIVLPTCLSGGVYTLSLATAKSTIRKKLVVLD